MNRVLVDVGAWVGADPELVERAVRAVLGGEGVDDAEVSVALLGDDAIRALNREHLGHDRPTDVLAFALFGEGESVVGDVYVGVEEARRQAEEAGVPPEEELVRLVVHGTLHTLGWTHPDEADARAASSMYRRQEELVARVLTETRGAS